MKPFALALIPIIGAAVLLCGQPYTNTNLLHTDSNGLFWTTGRSAHLYVSNAWPPIPRYYNREVFIGAGPTNIVISNDYKGTITIPPGYSLRIITNAP